MRHHDDAAYAQHLARVAHDLRPEPARPVPAAAVPRVLLVDQFWPIAGATGFTLTRLRAEGWTVQPVADGRQALDVARRERSTVALVALSVGCRGGMHALQVASALLDLAPTPQVLLVSASTRTGEVIWLNYRPLPVVRACDIDALEAAVGAAHAGSLGVGGTVS